MDKELNNYYEPSIKTSRNEVLKAIMELPKVETNNPIGVYGSINVDDLMSAVDRLNKVPTYDELLKENKKQKEGIDKAIKLIKYNERYRDGADCCQFVDIVSEILDPLQSILEQDETINNAYLKEFEDWLKEVSE